jgi:hypothetical protein
VRDSFEAVLWNLVASALWQLAIGLAGGAAVSLVADRIGLPIGSVLPLAVLGFALAFSIVAFIGRALKKSISDHLGEYLIRGIEIQDKCGAEDKPAPTAEAEAWTSDVQTFLSKHLGLSYVARFHNSAGLPLSATSITSREHRNVSSYMRVRLARLNEFIQDLEVGRRR